MIDGRVAFFHLTVTFLIFNFFFFLPCVFLKTDLMLFIFLNISHDYGHITVEDRRFKLIQEHCKLAESQGFITA